MPIWRKLHVKTVDSLDFNDMPDDFTRLLWVLLPLQLDQCGRGIDNDAWVRSKLFPLREDVTNAMIRDAMRWYSDRFMIERYRVGSRAFFWIPTWHKHQGKCDREAPSGRPAPLSYPEQEQGETDASGRSGLAQDQLTTYSSTEKNRVDESRVEKKREEQEQLTGDTPPVSASPPTLPSGIPDPSSLTVAQIKKLKLTKDQWRELGEAEEWKGKDRTGVHSLVERKTRAASPAVEVFREVTERYPLKAWWPDITQAVGDAPDDLKLWHQVVKGWCGMDYKKMNVSGMLDFFNRREIPSARGAANGQRSSGRASTPSRITPKPPVTDANTPTPEQLASDRRAVDKHLKRQREAAEAAATAGTG